MSRRAALKTLPLTAAVLYNCAQPPPPLRIAPFEADVTPPLGTPFLNGVRARSTADPLYAKGLVLLPAGQPAIVLAALDWCEIRHDPRDPRRGAA